MKKLLTFFLTMVLTIVGSVGAFAEEDVTSQYIKAWTFASGDAVMIPTTRNSSGITVIEFYHSWSPDAAGTLIPAGAKTFEMSQTVSLPAGVYRLEWPAFYREGNSATEASTEKASIYVNGADEVNFLPFAGFYGASSGDDLDKAAYAIANGNYVNTLSFTLATAGDVTIGAKGYIDTYCSWAVVGPVKLIYVAAVASAVTEEYEDVLELWQTVNTTNYRWDAEFEDQVVTATILNNMNEADKLIVKVAETNFDDASEQQNIADLAEARRLIEAAQTEAAANYEVLKANKDAYATINEEIQGVRDELTDAKEEIAQNYPHADIADKVKAIDEKIAKLQEDADKAFEDKTAVNFRDEILPDRARDIRNDIVALINDAKEQEAAYQIAQKFPAGDYLFFNVEAQAYLGGANSWGTQASAIAHAQIFTLEALATPKNGVYGMNSHVYQDDNKHFLGYPTIFVDQDKAEWTIAASVDGSYTISCNGNYLTLAEDGKTFTTTQDATVAGAQWQIVSYEDAVAALANGSDATFMIKNANFSRNAYSKETPAYAWTVSEDCTNKNLAGGLNENMCAESYHSSFTVSQTIEGLPDGYYTVTAQGYYRADEGNTNPHAVLFANERSVTLANITSGATPNAMYTEGGWQADSQVAEGFIPNSMNGASTRFTAGQYVNVVEVYVQGGTLTVGVKTENKQDWCCWDNFTLTYHGDDATAYTAFIKDALYEALDKVQEKLENFVEENADDITDAIQEGVDHIGHEIGLEREKIFNATADQEEEILNEIAVISEEIDNLINKVVANQAAYEELMTAYNALKDKWQATYDRINAKYAGMIDNEEYVIKIYRGETLTEEEREQIGAYEKDGAYYVDAFITRDDFNKILTGLNKVDYARNLDGYDDENDAIERSYAKGTCVENKENILAEIQKDLDAIDAVWNDARSKHDKNVLNANNTNLRQVQKAYETNVEFYKDAINVVNGHLKEWHDANLVQAANNALFDVYKAQEDAFKAANTEYTEVLEANDALVQQDLYPKEIFHYEAFAETLDQDVEGTCEGILAIARAAAVAENAEIYAAELAKANALLGKIAEAQAVVDTYAEDVKTVYTANLNAQKQEIETYINETLAPYDNDQDDPCIKEDQPTIDAAIDAFDAAIDQIAEDAEGAEEAYEANETAFADIKAQIEDVLGTLAEDRAIIVANNDEEEEPRAAVAEALEDDLMELLSEAEASKAAGTSVADKEAQLAELAELAEDVEEYFNNALLDVVNAKADAAAAYLAEVVEIINGYADAVKAIYLPKAEAIATEIAALKEAAKADWEDGELAETYEDYIDQIGVRLNEVKGLRVAAEPSIAIASYAGGTTGNMTEGNNAETLGLDPDYWTVTATVCEQNDLYPGLNQNGEIRLYGSETGKAPNTLTIAIAEGVTGRKITGVSFDLTPNYPTPTILVNGEEVEADDEGFYAVNDASFTITNTAGKGSSNQVRIKSINIYYGPAAVNPDDPDDPEAQTIYQKIEELKQAAAAAQANAEAYAEIIAAIEGTEETETTPATKGVQDELDEAKEAIESSIVSEEFKERIAELEQQLNDLKEQAEEAYNNGEAAEKKQEILGDLEEISGAIDELLGELEAAEGNAYRETLAADFDELKTYWNVSYAATDDEATLAELDRIYNEILSAYHETIEADLVISKEIFDATEAKINELTLAIQKATDLEQYLADNFLPGDPDGDGKVSINDVTAIIDIILSDSYDELTVEEFYTADTNGDGVINILDITAAINIILETVPEGNEAKTRAANNDYLVADGTELSLINANAYTTFQMDITVADGATLNDVVLADRAADLQVAFSQISDNTYRVVVASLQNRTIMGNEGLLINLDITGDQTAEYSNVLFSDVYARGYVLPIVSDATAIAAIKANVDADCQIFTMGGAQINSLQKGINIVKYADGSTKKLFVK